MDPVSSLVFPRSLRRTLEAHVVQPTIYNLIYLIAVQGNAIQCSVSSTAQTDCCIVQSTNPPTYQSTNQPTPRQCASP